MPKQVSERAEHQTLNDSVSQKRANTACTGRWGFCAIYEHFSGFEIFLLPAESTPAPAPVTQTVGRLMSQDLPNQNI